MAKSWDVCGSCGPGEWEEIEENVGFFSKKFWSSVQVGIRISGPYHLAGHKLCWS